MSNQKKWAIRGKTTTIANKTTPRHSYNNKIPKTKYGVRLVSVDTT